MSIDFGVADTAAADAVDFRRIENITGYTVTEEATPLDPSDTTGAAGKLSIRAGVIDTVAAKRMYRRNARLTDSDYGSLDGFVRAPSGAPGETSISVDQWAILFSATKTIPPYWGTLSGYFSFLLAFAGIPSGVPADIDSSFDAIDVAYLGWRGDVWIMMKALLAVHDAELAIIGDTVVIRPARLRIATTRNDSDVSWSIDDGNLAQSVEGYWYPSGYDTGRLVYPEGGWTPEVPVYQVEALEVLVIEIPLEAISPVSLEQPIPVEFVGRYDVSESVYSVTGNDGLPIMPAQWLAGGGGLRVDIGEDQRSIVVTITGAGIEQYSPFQIAMASGPSNTYSSLRIVGEGVFAKKHFQSWSTSVPPEVASQEVGVTLDIPFITSLEQFADQIAKVRSRYSGPRHILTARTDTPHTIDFDQVFGNVAGARVRRDGHWFRVRAATIDPGTIGYTAEHDTTGDDLNAFLDAIDPAMTIDDFNDLWDGATFDDFNMAPLTGGI